MTVATITLFAMTGTLLLMMLVLLIEGALMARTVASKKKRFLLRTALTSLASNRHA